MKKKLFFFVLGIVASATILAMNFLLIYPWFEGKGPANLGSIEVSYVSMARFIKDFYPHLSFAPYWYFGFPFHLFYTPLLPVLEVFLNKIADVHLWQAYRVVTGAGFIFAPVSLFLFSWYLTKKIIPGVLAALGYSFLPSLFYFVLSSGEVAKDVISQNFLDPRRLVILARWGEGPHTLSLAFLPLAALFYLRVLKTKKFLDAVLTGIFIGLTALANAVGLYALVLLLLAVFFARLVKKPKASGKVLKLSVLTAAITYGLIAFWYNLSFISSFFGEGGSVFKNYLSLFPWGFLILLWVIVALYFFFQKVIRNQAVIISFVWFLLLFLIVYIYYTSAPPEFSEARIELAPQALRLMTGVDMAFSLFLASIIGGVIAFLEKKGFVLKILGNLIGVVLIFGLLGYAASYFSLGQKAVKGEVKLEETGEYEIAQWLNKNVDVGRGERVFVAGNYGFYLNYFTNVWQLRGGLFQAATHPWSEHAYYQLVHGSNRELALAWLKAANAKFAVVNTPASRELYKEFASPEKFEDLNIVYDERGDLIYEVPLVNTEPAKVVDLDILKAFPPQKGDDQKALFAYVDFLDKAEPASFEAINNDLYQIKAKLGQRQSVLVQTSFDQGFSAFSKQGSFRIIKDPLGFMVLVPEKEGEYEITLRHGKTWKIWLGYLITMATIITLTYIGFLRCQGKPPPRWTSLTPGD